MNLREIVATQANFAEEINVRNGYTPTESKQADENILRLTSLAAYLDWDHEVSNVVPEFLDAPTAFVKNNLAVYYEAAQMISENRTGIKMDF
jgi:hypothetical protein